VSREIGEGRQGEFICGACQAEPMQIMKKLLELARSGKRETLAIQGYEIVRELGKGGMGAVYLARHEKTGEKVALKVMLPQVALNARSKAMFLREIDSTRALKHANIVEVKDMGCSEGTFFFTLEYCDGGSVDRLMKERGGTLAIAEAGDISLQVLAGLDHAHNVEVAVNLPDGSAERARGLVHRDLKPQNIFLSSAGKSRIAKVGDFGLAKAFDLAGLSGQTCTGSAAGTPVFMARQQVVNFKYAKPDVDVWAAAASLYFMLTGAFPREFPKGQDPWQIVLQNAAVPIRDRSSRIPPRLAEVNDQALIDKPAITFKTAAELHRALESVL
jgi:serine/threonine-protein kinase